MRKEIKGRDKKKVPVQRILKTRKVKKIMRNI